MFKTLIADFSAGYYDTAIIAAFVVLALIQSLVLRNKWHQAEKLKSDNTKIAVAASKALLAMMTGSFKALAQVERRAKAAEARADAAESEITAIMQAAADRDDEIENNRPFASGGRVDPTAFFYGDSHPAHDPNELHSLFAMLDGKGRNGAALDDLIFGRGNSPRRGPVIVHGGDLVHGHAHESVNVGDVLAAIAGDPSALEQKVGAKCIGLKVMRADGSEITGSERDDVIASLGGRSRPSFDIDPAAFGSQVHENIERQLNEKSAADSLHVGKHDPAYGPDESCSTQQPHGYAASSPRAG